MDYTIEHHTRRCATTGRDLHEGEMCYSAIVREGSQYLRRDYSPEGWSGPPAEAIGFWKSRVEPPDLSRRPKIDTEQVLDLFNRLADQVEGGESKGEAAEGASSDSASSAPDVPNLPLGDEIAGLRDAFRWVLALFLVRKKQLKLQGVRNEGEHEVLVVSRPGDRTPHEIRDPQLSEAQLAEVQQKLTALLETDLT